MANEITITTSLASQFPSSLGAGQNPEVFTSPALSTFKFTKAAVGGGSTVTSVATTAAGVAITLPASVSTNGWAFFLNLDQTNYVEVGQQTGGTTFIPVVRMNANEPALFRLSQGVSFFWRANTSAVNVLAIFLNN